jgi:hypothetical protein
MRFSRSKTSTTAVSLFLMFAMAVSLFALPTATAGEMQTYAFIGALPNPVGVGQEVLLHVGITRELWSALYGWSDLTVTVTRPDGTTETLGPFKTDSTGGTGTVYVPKMAGNYTLQTNFPEQEIEPGAGMGFAGISIPDGTIMKASKSDILTLVVTDEPIEYYPGNPLPTEYWTRPIDAQLREWSSIAGNWLCRNWPNGDRRDPQYVEGNDYAPETAHILWTMQETTGGLAGLPLDEHSFEIGDAYEGKFANRIILGGKLFYDKYSSVDQYHETVCVDLHTGEVLWSRVLLNNLPVSFGQLTYWDTYDYHGIYPYLWATGNVGSLSMLGFNITALGLTAGTVGNIWCAFNPFTGDFTYALYGVPSGRQTFGPKGEVLIYTVDQANGWMTMWNSTNIPWLYADRDYASMSWGQWRPYGKILNATGYANVTIGGGLFGSAFGTPYIAPTTPLGLNGYQWNKTIPKGLAGSVRDAFAESKIIGVDRSPTSVSVWGLNLNSSKAAIGGVLFDETWSPPKAWADGNVSVSYQLSTEEVVVLWVGEERKYYGFSAETGKYLWVTDESESYLNYYGWTEYGERPVVAAYGKLYSSGVSGIVYCYDLETGGLLWTYDAVDPYSEFLFSNNWWLFSLFVTDGKIYYGTTEHSPIDPRPRGGPFICLNATTGEEIFRADGLFRQTHWGGLAIIGDSIIATQDTYDQRIYGIGKGPSATTVTAPETVQPLGKPVLVKGMVTDISPGTEDYARTARFPSGVPAVADENMSDWMLYVYKQFERPADAVGVEVVLEVLDPNNNFYEVGRATSDASGFFSCMFTPEVPGKYTIIASFAGSKAYYGSFAETAIGVEEAPVATPAPTPTPAPMTDTYVTAFGIAIIVAIAIVGILLLRKR